MKITADLTKGGESGGRESNDAKLTKKTYAKLTAPEPIRGRDKGSG